MVKTHTNKFHAVDCAMSLIEHIAGTRAHHNRRQSQAAADV